MKSAPLDGGARPAVAKCDRQPQHAAGQHLGGRRRQRGVRCFQHLQQPGQAQLARLVLHHDRAHAGARFDKSWHLMHIQQDEFCAFLGSEHSCCGSYSPLTERTPGLVFIRPGNLVHIACDWSLRRLQAGMHTALAK